MNYEDFLDVKKEVSSTKYTISKPKLEIASAVKFEKGSTKIYWKSSHKNERYSSSEFLQKKAMAKLRVPFAKNTGPRGLNTEKKKNIVDTLVPHLDENIVDTLVPHLDENIVDTLVPHLDENIVDTLVPHLDENRRKFWLDLPTNEASRKKRE